jgi:DNA gyrase inhibitor GyrI
MSLPRALQIEEMDSMRIARIIVECESPEITAFKALVDWAKKNEPEPLDSVRFFGFNDPCPVPGQTVYKYEAWMTVSDKACGEGDVSIIVHPRRRYAVMLAPLREIGGAWARLGEAVRASNYKFDSGPALEEALTNPISTPFNKAEMRLYLPIRRA